ncbi:hypothetical protein E2F43_18315 [Seongchinamella unica]|uniref:Uncharacterized protein n=1 Tax=Seongchinamella unica TaxID=2547392 RepID=A0A4R5LN77_9GAMM|nr:hypothetical protein [Seongchinamella unica]TDG11666.1 hypothetical protein E2F43_18315 [Seongchinamella unica]
MILILAGEVRYEWSKEASSQGDARRVHRLVPSPIVFGSINVDNIGRLLNAAEFAGVEVKLGALMSLSSNAKVERHFRPLMCDSWEHAKLVYDQYIALPGKSAAGDLFSQELR